MARTRQVALALGVCLCSACDIVQGFQHAGDALFPPVSTYLDVPGYRMTSGHFRYLDMVTSSEPFILARSATDGDDTLYAMRFQSPVPCPIPNVASYWTAGGASAKRTYLAYFDGTNTGTLRFADLDCRLYDFTLDHASLPIGFTPSGLVIQVGSDLFDVDPSAGTTDLIAGSLEQVDAQRHIVRADGRIGVFDADWALVRWVGDGVVAGFAAYGSAFFEDGGGIERLTVSDTKGARSVSLLTIDPDGCDLTLPPATPDLELIAYHSPCADKKPVVWDVQTKEAASIDFDVDLSHVKFFGKTKGSHPNLAHDPFYALYVSDLDAGSDTGTLHLRSRDGSDVTLGSAAALERSDLATDASGGDYTGGFALLDATGATGRFVHFDLDGNVSDVVSGVVRRPAEAAWTRLVVAADADHDDLVEVVDGQPVTVARSVPQRRYAYVNRFDGNPLLGRLAWFHDLDGEVGTLSLAAPDPASGVLDDQGHEPLYAPTAVASGVFADGHGFMADLPGFVYFTDWDDQSGTGRLQYSNVELGFSATASDGVSDFLQPGSGLLYTVPFGSAAGIWLARGK